MQFTDLDPATCGSGERAMTAWYDMALSPCVEVAVDAKILAKQDWSGAGAKGGVFRLTVVPLDAMEAAVYIQVVPLGMEEFRDHLGTLEQDEHLSGLAAIRLPEVGKIQMMPREPPVAKAGFGILPFLWVESPEGEVQLPNQEDLKKEMFGLLRSVRAPKKATLSIWKKDKGKLPGTDAPAVLWPQYRDPANGDGQLVDTLAREEGSSESESDQVEDPMDVEAARRRAELDKETEASVTRSKARESVVRNKPREPVTRQQQDVTARPRVVTTPMQRATRTSRAAGTATTTPRTAGAATSTPLATEAATSTPKRTGPGAKQDLTARKSHGKKRRKRVASPESSSDSSVVSVSPGSRRRTRRRSSSESEDSGDSKSLERSKKKKPSKASKGSKSVKSKKAKKDRRKKKKRRSRSSSSEDSSSSSEEEVEMIDEEIHLVDDGVSAVDMELRHRLWTPTGAPDSWWKPPFKSNVSRPVRGGSLNMEPALGHARVHDATVRRLHHRTSLVTLRMLLGKNADISLKDSKLVSADGDKLSLDRNWKAPEYAWEIAEGVLNYCTIVSYVRGYSYEGQALLRALHDYGWFLGCVECEKDQLLHLEAAVDVVLARNRQRARDNRHPLTYEDIRMAIRGYLNGKGKFEPGLFGIDPYAGKKKLSPEASIQSNITKEVVNELMVRGWSQPGSFGKSGVKDRKKPRSSGEDKVNSCCKDFNSQGGCNQVVPCEKGQHKCSKRSGEFVCFRHHSASTCDNARMK